MTKKLKYKILLLISLFMMAINIIFFIELPKTYHFVLYIFLIIISILVILISILLLIEILKDWYGR